MSDYGRQYVIPHVRPAHVAQRSPISQNDLYVIDDQLTAAMREQNQALQNPFHEKPKMTTIGEQLKAARAQLAEVRQGAANAVADSADASRVVLVEVNKLVKEAEDLRAEVAELTNGGPA